MQVKSDIPVGAGLGSSAAFCVAISGALLFYALGKSPTAEVVNQYALLGEKFFHGTPSGLDNYTCSYGGLVVAERGTFVKLHLPERGEQLEEVRLVIIDSGIPKSTKEMVAKVRSNYERVSLRRVRIIPKNRINRT